MKGARFDILFTGELMAGADPEQVRRRLRQRFKLTEAAAAQLLEDAPVTIKRGVDSQGASRYREAFRDAGALIRIQPAAAVEPRPGPKAAPVENAGEGPIGAGPGQAWLQPDAPASTPTAPESDARPVTIDTSHLSLVPGWDWTLEDCQAPSPPAALPDTSHLRLIPRATADGEEGAD